MVYLPFLILSNCSTHWGAVSTILAFLYNEIINIIVIIIIYSLCRRHYHSKNLLYSLIQIFVVCCSDIKASFLFFPYISKIQDCDNRQHTTSNLAQKYSVETTALPQGRWVSCLWLQLSHYLDSLLNEGERTRISHPGWNPNPRQSMVPVPRQHQGILPDSQWVLKGSVMPLGLSCYDPYFWACRDYLSQCRNDVLHIVNLGTDLAPVQVRTWC